MEKQETSKSRLPQSLASLAVNEWFCLCKNNGDEAIVMREPRLDVVAGLILNNCRIKK